MNHRDRVQAALSYELPDRCPLQASFTPEFARRVWQDVLRRRLTLPEERGPTPYLSEPGASLHTGKMYPPLTNSSTAYQLERIIGSDLLLTSVGWSNPSFKDNGRYSDEWGIEWRPVTYTTPAGRGSYLEISAHPLAHRDALDHYQLPDPLRPWLYTEAKQVIETLGKDYWIVGDVVPTVFECAWALRGLKQLLRDFIATPHLAEQVLDIPFRYHLSVVSKLTEIGVDMILIGDDIGGQQGMLISPDHWRQFLKPRMAKLIRTVKKLSPSVKVAYHSDGSIYPIIPELIEIGVDVLNPLQPSAMDPVFLKKTYGNQLCFWGSIDDKYTLPFGTPHQVRKEVLHRLNTIGKRGGLIISPTHHLHLDIPLQNFWTLVNTVINTPYPH